MRALASADANARPDPAFSPSPIVNAMTVDVEDYYQVSAFEGAVARRDWSTMESRVERNTERLLEMFATRGVRATFFVLGWVAERHPALVRRLAEAGHEIGSHGYDHTRVVNLDRAGFRADVTRTKALLEDASGVAVRGYRAPSFSIGSDNLWALEVLHEAGHEYSSSIYPVRHDLYGFPAAPRFSFIHRASGILEIPITTVRAFGRNFPAGGGGFFRLYPMALTRLLIRRVNALEHEPCVFYTHPWEFDASQPRPAGVPWRSRFRHYLNLERMPDRLDTLLRDFRWGRMDEIFLGRPVHVSL